MTRTLLALALLVSSLSPALAGIVDSPIPTLGGASAVHLYSVPGVTNDNGLATLFACTSTANAPIRVAVEVFANGGGGAVNIADATSVLLNPGAGVLFATSLTNGFVNESSLGLGGVVKGSARILSTSKSLICTALVVDVSGVPPTSMVSLTIIKGTKQKAAN